VNYVHRKVNEPYLRLDSAFIRQTTCGIIEWNSLSAQCWKVLSNALDIVAGDSDRHDGEGLFQRGTRVMAKYAHMATLIIYMRVCYCKVKDRAVGCRSPMCSANEAFDEIRPNRSDGGSARHQARSGRRLRAKISVWCKLQEVALMTSAYTGTEVIIVILALGRFTSYNGQRIDQGNMPGKRAIGISLILSKSL
jgi:hypothetical protein